MHYLAGTMDYGIHYSEYLAVLEVQWITVKVYQENEKLWGYYIGLYPQ
jgi:hypothetical protein